MSDNIEITVKVNGKLVPLSNISDETLLKIRSSETEKDAPVFSKTGSRLIIKLNNNLKNSLRIILGDNPKYFSLEPDGRMGAYDLGNSWAVASKFYSGMTTTPIFNED